MLWNNAIFIIFGCCLLVLMHVVVEALDGLEPIDSRGCKGEMDFIYLFVGLENGVARSRGGKRKKKKSTILYWLLVHFMSPCESRGGSVACKLST